MNAGDDMNHAATRLDPGGSDQHAFTRVSAHEQPSAWARGALYSSGLLLMALVLTVGWLTARPTPRRRPPLVPPPAWSRARPWRR